MEKSRILKSYHIQYLANGFIQKKYLVSKDDWDNIIKPIKKAITIIEDDNKGKENIQSKLLKDSLKIMYGDYTKCFPEGSPFHDSIKTGYLELLAHQGGKHPVKWIEIK